MTEYGVDGNPGSCTSLKRKAVSDHVHKVKAKSKKAARRTFFFSVSNDGTMAYFLPVDGERDTQGKDIENDVKTSSEYEEQGGQTHTTKARSDTQNGDGDLVAHPRRSTRRDETRQDTLVTVRPEMDDKSHYSTLRNVEAVQAQENATMHSRFQRPIASKDDVYRAEYNRAFSSKHKLRKQVNTLDRNVGQHQEKLDVTAKQIRSKTCDVCGKNFVKKGKCVTSVHECRRANRTKLIYSGIDVGYTSVSDPTNVTCAIRLLGRKVSWNELHQQYG